MINITQAQANQTTTNGVNSEWTVTLGKEELYRLPEHFSVQETFMVRDIVEKMMKRAEEETKEQEQQLSLVKLNYIVSNGDTKLEGLKRENLRLAQTLETLIGEES